MCNTGLIKIQRGSNVCNTGLIKIQREIMCVKQVV